jgi:hypothetical protein
MNAYSPLLDQQIRVPEHVVYRDFADETVVLNLESGMYHGLNRVAARMLEVAQASDPLRDAVPLLADEFAQPPEVIERDLLTLCQSLLERGLIDAEDRADAKP